MARTRKRPTENDLEAASALVGVYAARGRPRALDVASLRSGRVRLRKGETLVCVPRLQGELDSRVAAFRIVLKALDDWRRARYGVFVPHEMPSDAEFEVWRCRRGSSLNDIASNGHEKLLGPMHRKNGTDRIDTRRSLAARAVRKVNAYLRTPQGQALQRTAAFRLARKKGFSGFTSSR